jgi:CheY-like chemotaxis protein
VHLYLPKFEPASTAKEEAAVTPGQQLPSGPVTAATILLVDDEKLVRFQAAEALRELGYRVLEAGDGPAGLNTLREALRNSAAGGVDLLVTDVGLPGGLNGRQLADVARTLLPDLPVLLITGYAGDAINGRGRLAPGMEVLGKPFPLELLSERVQVLIQQQGRPDSARP